MDTSIISRVLYTGALPRKTQKSNQIRLAQMQICNALAGLWRNLNSKSGGIQTQNQVEFKCECIVDEIEKKSSN